MLTFVTILLILIAIILIAVVLIQPGKGDMIAGMGTIGGSITNMFGSRKAADLLQKITIGLAIAMFVLVIFANKFLVGSNSDDAIKPITEGIAVPAQQTVPTPMPSTPAPAPEENK